MRLSKQHFLWFFMLMCAILPKAEAFNNGEKKEFVRTYKKDFLGMNERTTLQLYNMYGNIDIRHNSSANSNIVVKITVFANSESEAEAEFNRVQVKFDNSTTWAKAETSLTSDRWSKNRSELKIDMDVAMPANCHLDLRNQYGNANIPDMKSNVAASVSYGDIRIGAVSGNLDLITKYGSAHGNGNYAKANIKSQYSNVDFKGDAPTVVLSAQYGAASFGDISDLNADLQYNNLSVGAIKNLKSTAAYSDVSVGSLTNLTATGQYSNYHIGALSGNLSFDGSYGDVSVGSVGASFGTINFKGDYANLKLKMSPGCSYAYDVRGYYADISVPQAAKSNASENNTNGMKRRTGTVNGGKSGITVQGNYSNVFIY